MPCMCNTLSSRCGCCGHFLKALDVVVDGGEIVLLVRQQIFDNYDRYILCITKPIPATSTEETVYIQPGISTTNRYQLRTTDGNPVYAHQLCPRTPYPVTVATGENGFVVNPKHLKHTTQILTPPTSASGGNTGENPEPASAKSAKTVKAAAGGDA